MGEYYGVSKKTILNHGKKIGLKFERYLVIPTIEQEQYALDNINIKSNKKIAEELNLPSFAISRIFKKYNKINNYGVFNYDKFPSLFVNHLNQPIVVKYL